MDLRGLEWSKVYLRWSWVYTNLILSEKVTQNAWDGPGSETGSHGAHNTSTYSEILAFFSIFEGWRQEVVFPIGPAALECSYPHPWAVGRAGARFMKPRWVWFPGGECAWLRSFQTCTFSTWKSKVPAAHPDCCIRYSATVPNQNNFWKPPSRSTTLLPTSSPDFSKKMLLFIGF